MSFSPTSRSERLAALLPPPGRRAMATRWQPFRPSWTRFAAPWASAEARRRPLPALRWPGLV
eukprot:4022372-Lingulodinium_polyedra.AAC.1